MKSIHTIMHIHIYSHLLTYRIFSVLTERTWTYLLTTGLTFCAGSFCAGTSPRTSLGCTACTSQTSPSSSPTGDSGSPACSSTRWSRTWRTWATCINSSSTCGRRTRRASSSTRSTGLPRRASSRTTTQTLSPAPLGCSTRTSFPKKKDQSNF